MRVGIDVDGVVADFVLSFTSLAKEMGLVKEVYPTAQQKDWSFPFDTNPVWERVKASYNWWMTLQPLVSLTEIAHLNAALMAHDIYFVTSRPRTLGLSAERQTACWLEGIGVSVVMATVIATKTGTKGALMKSLDIDVAIDDYILNLEDIDQHGIKAFARSWSYNEGWPVRVGDLSTLLRIVGVK